LVGCCHCRPRRRQPLPRPLEGAGLRLNIPPESVYGKFTWIQKSIELKRWFVRRPPSPIGRF
jgi:hypothetical protein